MDLFVPVADSVSLHVRHWPGEGSRTGTRAFLLLHGLLSNARMWDEVAGRLATQGHPVYAVNQRGHGQSDTPDEGYENATAVSDLAAVTAALGLNGALVAGHSWAAQLALRLAVEYPALVGGLALVDGGWYEFDGPTMDAFFQRSVGVVRRAQQGTTTIAEMREYLRFMHPRWSPTAIEARLADYRVGPDGLLTPRLSEAQVMSIVASLRRESPGQWLPKVTVPVMLLPVLPTSMPRWAQNVRRWVDCAEAVLPQATVRWYPDADHDLHAAEPHQVARDLLDLARDVGPPTTV